MGGYQEYPPRDLVRALSGLDHLHLAGHVLGEQVERHGVVRDHRLTHRAHSAGKGVDDIVVSDLDAVVIGGQLARDQVGVEELVALAAGRVAEADREGRQLLLALVSEQGHYHARVKAAR